MVGDEVDHSSPRQRCYDPVEARSVLPDLWKTPAAEEFPAVGFEAGLERWLHPNHSSWRQVQIFLEYIHGFRGDLVFVI